MPIATLLRPLPTAQWSDSCRDMMLWIDSSSNVTPRITAAPSTGRMSASFGSMVNDIPEGFTGYRGRPVSIPR